MHYLRKVLISLLYRKEILVKVSASRFAFFQRVWLIVRETPRMNFEFNRKVCLVVFSGSNEVYFWEL